ncbi:MAG: putative lipid II flippase FtsW [Acidobacteria bacterium]|nr:putative lipid II flippase FtsW [Acidobacteriota bacterium]
MAQRLRTDWTLFFTVIAMVGFGLVMVYSASSVTAELKGFRSEYYLLRQAGWAVAAFVALMLFKRLDYKMFQTPAWAFAPLGVVLVLLVAVYFTDPRTHRWLRLGPVQFQPSELAKPALIIFLAYFVTRRLGVINHRSTILPAALALAVLAGAVVAGDLGTALVPVITAATVFFVAGMDKRYFLAAGAALTLLVAVGIAMKPYRLSRLIGYLDPDYQYISIVDPQGHLKKYAASSLTTRDPGYQAKQSRIAVGAGGVAGLGLMHGVQKITYLPESHTDFIFAVVGEELGLIGTGALLCGFLVILWRGLGLFWTAPDDFGRYIALAATVSIIVQVLINLIVVLDMAPTKGITLPMISYGGSSLLCTLVLLGMMMSVSDRSA